MKRLGKDKDLRRYVLHLENDIEFADRTLKGISKFVNHLILKAEKQQLSNLIKLLAESSGFEGVEKFDSHHVPPLLSEEYLNCWSLPLVTLTTISMSLPNIKKNLLECLLIRGVSEGLVNAAKALWVEVEVYHKWFGNMLQNPDPQLHTTGQILLCLRDTTNNMLIKMEGMSHGVPNDMSKFRAIYANSMYRITETILLSYHYNIDTLSQEELFVMLSLVIADILSTCLTNLPQVILKNSSSSLVR
uniref:Uncharacterized protein n=1 Tax=Lactuca sativa TaxID=4236 RepID=A0A9R1V2X6_LACSA|nr:hypothetical protein LSAT_V11C600314280 [Lactuca sativa]